MLLFKLKVPEETGGSVLEVIKWTTDYYNTCWKIQNLIESILRKYLSQANNTAIFIRQLLFSGLDRLDLFLIEAPLTPTFPSKHCFLRSDPLQ